MGSLFTTHHPLTNNHFGVIFVKNTGKMKKLLLSLLVTLISIPVFSVTPLTVVSPNGGENWITGCPYAIQWITGNVPGPVKIELYNNNSFYLTICSQVSSGMTSYTWVPPATILPGNGYKVKITSLTSAAGFDFSDGTFTIGPGVITVTSPNGGETWQRGSSHPVLWTDNICDNVRIELWKGGVFNSLITASAPSNGTYTWTIPATMPTGPDYKVKIMSATVNTGAATQVFDFSDANFAIAATPLTVLTPNGGENWYGGGIYTIRWIDAVAEYVRIELWKGGAMNSVISNSAIGPFNWAIPAAIAAGSDYKVKVIALTSAGNFDYSDNIFTISQAPFIMVTSPNGGEIWEKGTTRIITWLDNVTWNVRIELWKGGSYCSLINASAPGNGSCYWAIPATLLSGNDYKVKILALGNSSTSLFDFSDNSFTINGPNPTPAGTPFGFITTYPNPFSNLLHVQFQESSASAVDIEILNFTGNVMFQKSKQEVMAGETLDLNTSALPGGNYLVVVKKNERVVSRVNVLLHR